MMKIAKSVEDLIGHTPLIRLERLEKELGLKAEILAKAEMFNPAGSAKDRIAKEMLDAAEKEGKLKPGATVIEPTSGNTGIGLCALAAMRGYRAVIVMPDTMSKERILLMKAYGAKVVLTPGALGLFGCVEEAKRIAAETPGAIIPDQFGNENNPAAHFKTTGPEIYADTDGTVDIFVGGVGTGGTVTGTAKYLKSQKPEVRIVAVEPKRSPLLSEGFAAPHGIQGIGANFIPKILDRSLIDEIFPVLEEDAVAAARLLARREGLFAGISSGAALYAACEIAKREENANKRIVVLLPDTGDRYLSTPDFVS